MHGESAEDPSPDALNIGGPRRGTIISESSFARCEPSNYDAPNRVYSYMGNINPADIAAQVQRANEQSQGPQNHFHMDFSNYQAVPVHNR